MFKQIAIAAALTAAALSSAQAGVIVSAQSATILSGGGDGSAGNITSTHDLEGLFTNYTSGVTDFDTYIAGNPLHVPDFSVVDQGTTYYYDWFAAFGSTSMSVSYDLGTAMITHGLALWNEDANGIGSLTISASLDGVNWTTLGSGLTPTDNPTAQNYGADVFSWGDTTARYIKLDGSACPVVPGGWAGCSIGEVAFNVTAVPEPSSIAMAGLGLALVGAVAARRRKQA